MVKKSTAQENQFEATEKDKTGTKANKIAAKLKQFFKFKLLPKKRWQKVLVIFLFLLIIILSASGVIAYYTYQTAMEMKSQTLEAKAIAQQAYDNFKAQNLPETQNKINELKGKLDQIKGTYAKLSFYQKIPYAKDYYMDGVHGLKSAEYGLEASSQTIDALVPYADVLGFEGEGSFTGGTAEDRIRILIETLDKIMPEFDKINENLNLAEAELAQIDASRYPEKFREIEVRSQLAQVQDTAKNATQALTEFRPVIKELPTIAGGRGERKKYLILFQNDNELRPTGGFLTAYAVVYIDNGKVTPEKSDDIYELDKKFYNKVEIPEELGRYLTTEKYWNLRDMNISPDFKTSMDQFFENYQTLKGEPDNIDGIISVDTEVLTQLLTILGPVEVPGYGTFSAEIDERCDCAQVVYALSEIITRPTPYLREDRKGVLGPLMQAILQKTYGAPKQHWPQLFELVWKSMEGRHLQMYFVDEKSQTAAEAVNAAGRMIPYEDGDFLAIVNANLGGAKSNLFTNYEVKQFINDAPQDGRITKKVEISYKNTRKADNCNLEAGELCLNSTLQDWTRLYLPEGSQLISAQGFTKEAKEYDEAGFHVIDGYFTLEPMAAAKIIVEYTVPYEDNEMYRVKLWKQGGISPVKTLIEVTGGQEEVILDKDTVYEVEF